ncbi:MAG: AbrB/MazE/SpoVT family DNA-binding domain-containing protein [candidate division NC10 bacterium]|nr:AbrB/MazE/SpoVT family DNA-binding domain-containing protein [candidate division NC10 bacterium]
MPVVTTSAKGQVVIPAAFRKKIGLKPGAKVLVTMASENRVTIEPIPDDPIKALRGILKGGPSLTKALLRERRKDRQREAEKLARFVRHHGLDPGRTGRSDRRGSARPSPSKT